MQDKTQLMCHEMTWARRHNGPKSVRLENRRTSSLQQKHIVSRAMRERKAQPSQQQHSP